MALRIAVVVTVFAMIVWTQTRTVQLSTPGERGSGSLAGLLDGPLGSVAIADNDDGDNDDSDNDDGDNNSGDNDDNDSGDNDDNNSDDNDSSTTTSDPNEDIVI